MKKIIIIISGILLLILAFLASYSRWNAASPAKTCASCHEISHSVDYWAGSAHRDIACMECHGTALSEGLHSLKEKGAMVFHHIGRSKPDHVGISEDQLMDVMQRCKGCHQTEYAKWNSGGHAMNYSDVFLNSVHNKAEPIYEDCLRCHGMFYDKGTVRDIVEPLDIAGPWKLKNASQGERPAIPCFACHQVHQSGYPGIRQNLETPASLHYSRMKKTFTSFYYRRDSTHFPVLSLTTQEINYNSTGTNFCQSGKVQGNGQLQRVQCQQTKHGQMSPYTRILHYHIDQCLNLDELVHVCDSIGNFEGMD